MFSNKGKIGGYLAIKMKSAIDPANGGEIDEYPVSEKIGDWSNQ